MNNLIIDIHGTRRDILENIGRDFDANIERLEESTKIDSVIHDKINEGYDGFIIVTKDTDKAQKYFEKKFSNVDIAVCSPDGKMNLREALDQQTQINANTQEQYDVYYFLDCNPLGLEKDKCKKLRDWLISIFNNSKSQKTCVYYLRNPNGEQIFVISAICSILDIGCGGDKTLSLMFDKRNNGYNVSFEPKDNMNSITNKFTSSERYVVDGLSEKVKNVLQEIEKLPKEVVKSDIVKKIEATGRVDEVSAYLKTYQTCIKIAHGEEKRAPGAGKFGSIYDNTKKIANDIGLGGAVDVLEKNVLDVGAIVQLKRDTIDKFKKFTKDSTEKDKDESETVELDKLKFKWHYTEHAADLLKALYGDSVLK